MLRLLLLTGMLAAVSACHTVPDPNDPVRQQRIDDCLKQCGNAEPSSPNTAYQADPVAQRDTRSSCERRCHQIP